MKFITTYKDYAPEPKLKERLRGVVRNCAIYGFSYLRGIKNSGNWIRFPYYHHVFDDEVKDFERQLKYLKNFGEFISLDQVCTLVNNAGTLDGKYYCVSFDDGYRCCYSNMMPITAELDIPVIIYLPTNYIGLSEYNADDILKIKQNYPECPNLELFLSWSHCREMLNHKVSFGSHTCGHVNLMALSVEQIEHELLQSKQIIEQELSVPCIHFACPWGRVNVNFDPAITKPIAQKLGYETFATTHRGQFQKGDDLFLLKRDHLLAEWGNYQLKYFFSM